MLGLFPFCSYSQGNYYLKFGLNDIIECNAAKVLICAGILSNIEKPFKLHLHLTSDIK